MGFEPMIYCLQDSRIKPDYTNQPIKQKKEKIKEKKLKSYIIILTIEIQVNINCKLLMLNFLMYLANGHIIHNGHVNFLKLLRISFNISRMYNITTTTLQQVNIILT